MVDPVFIARDRLSKAQARVQRLEKQLQSARSEMVDLQTAVRVMAQITGDSELSEATPPSAGRQIDIIRLLPEGEARALPPATLFESYRMIASDAITLDTFRTTLWRMKGTLYLVDDGDWSIRAADGKYWKEHYRPKKEASGDKPKASNSMGPHGGEAPFPSRAPEGSIPSGSTHVPASFDADLDDDVPF